MPSPIISRLWRFLGSRPVTRVQSKSANTGNGTVATLTITLDANATIGNTLIVAVASGQTQVASATYGSLTKLYGTLASSVSTQTAILFIPVVEASPTIVVNCASNTQIAAVVVEYSGTIIAPDIPPLTATGTATSNATGTLTATRYANELIVAVMGRRGTFSSEQTGWLTSITNSFLSVLQTSTFTNVANSDKAVAFLERIVTSTGTYSTAGTQASSVFSNIIAAFVGG